MSDGNQLQFVNVNNSSVDNNFKCISFTDLRWYSEGAKEN
ncbi:16823_t:CDS:2 [Entrophospora sp. SA101]|nr:16823_t:CDS:2 [Entrophospora sp. SA101]